MRTSSSDTGASVVELLLVMLMIVALAAMSAPAAPAWWMRPRAARPRLPERRFRLARQRAVTLGANVGVVFDQSGSRWLVRVCRDGSRNGCGAQTFKAARIRVRTGLTISRFLFPASRSPVDPQLRVRVANRAVRIRSVRLVRHRQLLARRFVHRRFHLSRDRAVALSTPSGSPALPGDSACCGASESPAGER
jgi:Tfp pilus assembly protein FimT